HRAGDPGFAGAARKQRLSQVAEAIPQRMKPAGLILASKSPRRRALLKTLGIPFQVVPSGVSEASKEKRPHRLVQALALRKAEAVARRFKTDLILGADTLVILGREILGQPKDAGDAYRMLYRLAGTTHRVFTGVALVDAASGKSQVAYAVS